MTNFHELPDYMSQKELLGKFEEFLQYYNIPQTDKPYMFDELLELADRQWQTYSILDDSLRKRVETFIKHNIDFDNYEIMDSVLSIIPRLGLVDVFNYVLDYKKNIHNLDILTEIKNAETEYGSNVENPYFSINPDNI